LRGVLPLATYISLLGSFKGRSYIELRLLVKIAAESHQVLMDAPISTDNGVTQAEVNIIGTNKILAPNGKAEFRAGHYILFKPGFEVEEKATFSAIIKNGCMKP
jgi:hypothetical protein